MVERQAFPVGDIYSGQLVQANKPVPVKGELFYTEIDIPGVLAAAAYAANDQVGELFPIPVTNRAGGGGWIDLVVLFESTAQQIAMDLIIFHQGVVNAVADNAAASITDPRSRALLLGGIHITDYFSIAANAFGVARNQAFAFKCRPNETTLHGLLITRGAPTYDISGLKLKVTTILE